MVKLLRAPFHSGSDCAPSNAVDLAKPANPMISTRWVLASALFYNVFSSTCSASSMQFCATSLWGDSGISRTENPIQITGTEPALSVHQA